MTVPLVPPDWGGAGGGAGQDPRVCCWGHHHLARVGEQGRSLTRRDTAIQGKLLEDKSSYQSFIPCTSHIPPSPANHCKPRYLSESQFPPKGRAYLSNHYTKRWRTKLKIITCKVKCMSVTQVSPTMSIKEVTSSYLDIP